MVSDHTICTYHRTKSLRRIGHSYLNACRLLVLSMFVAILPSISGYAELLSNPLEEESSRSLDGRAIRSQLDVWDDAVVQGNVKKLEGILAPEYVAAGTSREVYLASLKLPGLKITESDRDNIYIRFYGTTAIVFGQWTQRGDTSEFGSFVSTFGFTDLWVQYGETWKCVATSADHVRKSFSKVKSVRMGPDVETDVVILFAHNTESTDIEIFREEVVYGDHVLDDPIAQYTRVGRVEGHDALALELSPDFNDVTRKLYIQRLLASPIVFRVFENIAPDEIVLDDE